MRLTPKQYWFKLLIFLPIFIFNLRELNMAFWSAIGTMSLLLLTISAIYVIADITYVLLIRFHLAKSKNPFKRFRLIFSTLYVVAFLLLMIAIIEIGLTHDPSGSDWLNTYILPNLSTIGGISALPAIYLVSVFWYRANSVIKYVENRESGLPSELNKINTNLIKINTKLEGIDNDIERLKDSRNK